MNRYDFINMKYQGETTGVYILRTNTPDGSCEYRVKLISNLDQKLLISEDGHYVNNHPDNTIINARFLWKDCEIYIDIKLAFSKASDIFIKNYLINHEIGFDNIETPIEICLVPIHRYF